jgi:hypothetical protein
MMRCSQPLLWENYVSEEAQKVLECMAVGDDLILTGKDLTDAKALSVAAVRFTHGYRTWSSYFVNLMRVV